MATQSAPAPAPGSRTRGLLWGLFALPFLGFGLGAIAVGVGQLREGNGRLGVLAALFGALFVGVGALVLVAVWSAAGDEPRVAERRARHPEEPWRWSGRWDDPRLRSGSRAGLVAAWLFALVWNAISSPVLLVFLPQEAIAKGRWAEGLVAALFPLIGVGLLVLAARATLQWRRFGFSTLELARVPGVLGGELAATLHASPALAEARELALRLDCIRQTTTGSGKNRSTQERIEWSEEHALALAGAARGPYGLALPLRFAIPFDVAPSDPLPSANQVLWRLSARATLPGVDYGATFEVPVFQTPESSPERTLEALGRAHGASPPAAGEPGVAGVALRPLPEGGTEIRFRAGRNLGPAALAALFAGAFGGGAALARAHGAPVLVVAACAAVAALVAFGALSIVGGSTRLLARRGALRIERRLLGIGRAREIPLAEIAAISVEPGMQAGRRLYWDLRLHLREEDGLARHPRGIPAGGALRERLDAERLAALLREALGV